MKRIRLAPVFLLLVLAACSQIESLVQPLPATQTPVRARTPTPAPSPFPTASPTRGGPPTLAVWLPPEFDPHKDTPAGKLLRARLDEFTSKHAGVRIEVRVKAAEGTGGLLDTLLSASAAAPLALPDLVALPRPLLETAALKGLLHPFDDLSQALNDPDWFDYANQLARLQNSIFGLPFAGDALILALRPAEGSQAPQDWPAALQSGGTLTFPAADPQALFTLALYQASGGRLRDDQGRPYLDPAALVKVLDFYQQARQIGLAPEGLALYQADSQSWEAFLEKRASMAVTWTSIFFREPLTDTLAATLPTETGAPFTIATGWVWALSTPQAERQPLAAELAEFLTESSFLSAWTQAAGYLPVRPSTLKSQTQNNRLPFQRQVVESAHLVPPTDVLTSLGPPVQNAVVQVLKGQKDAFNAGQEAARAVAGPQ